MLLFFFSITTLRAQNEVQYQRDSVIGKGGDCTEHFFSRTEKIASPSQISLLLKNQKTVKLGTFLLSIHSKSGEYINAPSTAELPDLQEYGLIDLDKDGKKELLISNYTGGAHCCDELYIFKNIGPNKYQYAAKTFAGDVCISDYNEFTYNFNQQLGYFFTCFACGYTDTSDAAPVELRGIILTYRKGKLVPVPGDQELRSIINDNLGKLGEQPYEKLEDAAAQDNGLRKEFAMNLAVFYYSFGKNLAETKKLFMKYYKFPDAQKVWAEFVKQLQYIQKSSDI
ncbi:MAG: hypothetical protein ABIR30_12135 [Chitinophagaceae bacterium]